jgi:hypothetical protein
MAKIKAYRFRDGSAFTSNKDLIEAIGDAPHVRQLSVVVAAASKPAALKSLNAVGLGVNASAIHLVLADSPRITKWQEEGLLTEGTVLASSLIPRNGNSVVSLKPTEDRYCPEITKVASS